MKFILMMLLTVNVHAEAVLVPKYNEICVDEKLKECGNMKINHGPPFSEEERKVIMCRLDVLMQCQEGVQEVKP